MRAIVTGGAGFIGANLVDAPRARGDQVTVIDELPGGRRKNRGIARAREALGGAPTVSIREGMR
jgi:UDP-glucose 4-epimerase